MSSARQVWKTLKGSGIKLGSSSLAYRDLALVGRACGLGIDPVGRDGALRPHYDDSLRLIERA
jgi:hypothetical protein